MPFQCALTFLMHHVGSSALTQITVWVKKDPDAQGGLRSLFRKFSRRFLRHLELSVQDFLLRFFRDSTTNFYNISQIHLNFSSRFYFSYVGKFSKNSGNRLGVSSGNPSEYIHFVFIIPGVSQCNPSCGSFSEGKLE